VRSAISGSKSALRYDIHRAEAVLGDKVKARATAQEALPHLEENLDPASA
jgi:hypothetical protein